MANIIPLKESSGAQFYPQTHEKAVVDSNGVTLASKLANISAPSYVVAWDGNSTPVVANIPAGVTFTYGGSTYTGTLAASSSTVNKIYLVGDNNGNFDEYITQVSGSTYSWLYLGNTSIDLSDYATKGELNQLDQEVDSLNATAEALVDYTDTPTVNLFDKTAATTGKYVNKVTGELASFSGYFATDFIPIDSRGLYFTAGYAGGAVMGTAIYDSNKVFRRTGVSKQNDFEEGDAYVRYTGTTANIDAAMAVAGTSADVPSTYVPYGTVRSYALKDDIVEFDSLKFKVAQAGKNKLNPDAVTSGRYINYLDGSVGIWADTCASDFIPVSRKGLYCNKYYVGGATMGAAVYDSNKHYLRSCPNPYVYEDGDAFVRYTIQSAELATAQVEIGTAGTEYEAYTEAEVIDPNYLPSSERDGGVASLDIFLPDEIQAVVGDTLQLFYKGVVKAVDALNYDIAIRCTKGRPFRRYWEYTPALSDVGSTTLSIFVRDDNGNALASKTCNLVTVASPSSPASQKNVVCIGASETSNGIWPAEAYRRLTASGGVPEGKNLSNIAFCGPMTKDGAGYIGKSGWGWADYCTQGRPAFRFTIGTTPIVAMGNVYTNNGHSYTVVEISDDGTILCATSSASNTPQASGTLTKTSGSGDATVTFTASAADSQNPFWDYQNEKLTFKPYADAYCDGQIDAVYINLGINGASSFQEDFTTVLGYIKTFADTLHAEFPSAKLVLMSYCLPSMVLAMPGYGATSNGDTFGTVTTIFNMQKAYQEFADDADYSDFVDYIALAPETDSDYNFPITQKDVNTRNATVQEPYANNTIHAGTAGYLQFADTVYRHFAAKFCQS